MDVPTNIRNMCVIAQYVLQSYHFVLESQKSGAKLKDEPQRLIIPSVRLCASQWSLSA